MFPGAYQHPSSNPTKFMDGSHKTVIYENSCPVRYDFKLELRGDDVRDMQLDSG